MTITIVTRTPLVGPATWPPDLNVLRAQASVAATGEGSSSAATRPRAPPRDDVARAAWRVQIWWHRRVGFGGIGRRRERNVGF